MQIEKGGSRAFWNGVKNLPGGVKGPGTIIFRSILSSSSTVKFQPLAASFNSVNGNNTVGLNLLPIDYTFAINRLGFFLGKVEAAASAVTDANLIGMALQTYENSTVFDASNESTNISSIYNGKLNISINNVQYYDGYDMRRYRKVPTSQEGTTTTAYVNAGSSDATTTIAQSGYGHDTSVFETLTPGLILQGKDNIDWEVNLDTSVNLNVDSANSTNYGVWFARGYFMA